jgi:hypothetical protein
MKNSGDSGSLENGLDAMEVERSEPSSNKPNCDTGKQAIHF